MDVVFTAAPAPAPVGGTSAGNARYPPVVSRRALAGAQVAMAAAATAFALFSFTLKPFSFPHLPAECATTAMEIRLVRYCAGVLLLVAAAQVSVVTAALVVVSPSRISLVLDSVAKFLGLLTPAYLLQVVFRSLFAIGVFCHTSRLHAVMYILHAIPAVAFLFAVPILAVLSLQETSVRQI